MAGLFGVCPRTHPALKCSPPPNAWLKTTRIPAKFQKQPLTESETLKPKWPENLRETRVKMFRWKRRRQTGQTTEETWRLAAPTRPRTKLSSSESEFESQEQNERSGSTESEFFSLFSRQPCDQRLGSEHGGGGIMVWALNSRSGFQIDWRPKSQWLKWMGWSPGVWDLRGSEWSILGKNMMRNRTKRNLSSCWISEDLNHAHMFLWLPVCAAAVRKKFLHVFLCMPCPPPPF